MCYPLSFGTHRIAVVCAFSILQLSPLLRSLAPSLSLPLRLFVSPSIQLSDRRSPSRFQTRLSFCLSSSVRTLTCLAHACSLASIVFPWFSCTHSPQKPCARSRERVSWDEDIPSDGDSLPEVARRYGVRKRRAGDPRVGDGHDGDPHDPDSHRASRGIFEVKGIRNVAEKHRGQTHSLPWNGTRRQSLCSGELKCASQPGRNGLKTSNQTKPDASND